MKVVDVKKLTVKYNGRVVGYLAEVDGRIAFQYDSEWQENGFSISPFSLPISIRGSLARNASIIAMAGEST